MKRLHKLASIILAIAMVLTLASGVFAIDISLNGATEGHVYNVYQIFTGVLEGNKLTNIKYGANYTPGEVTTDTLVPQTELDALADAREFAGELVSGSKLEGEPVAVLNKENDWKAAGLTMGYYLIQDVTENLPVGETYSAYIVEIIDNTEIKTKAGTTELDKKITGDDNNIEGDITSDGKYDNVSVGSAVEYTITAKIPGNAKDFDFMYFIINDTLSEGLTFNEDVKVFIGGIEQAAGTDYVLHTGDDADGHTFQVALLKAKNHSGETVTVTYSATLNENAVIGEIEGNPNTANLIFSNDPNFKYEPTDDNDDGKPDEPGETEPTEPGQPTEPTEPGDGELPPLGETPDMVTRTYTTGIKILKVDQDGNPLTGAKFTITGTNLVDVLVVESETFTESADGSYYKLVDGTYTETAPTGETAGQYESTTVKYTKTIEYNTVELPREDASYEAAVDENGYLTFAGLGQGTYVIEETVVPDGYNDVDPITVVITWEAPETGSNDCDWTAKVGENELRINSDGVFELTVENRSGTTMPETGGMGTTMIYIIGSILVLGTAVLLITKKRMACEA